MVAMNPRLVVLLLCASLIPAVQARAKTILPDSCGDPDIKFDVSTKKNQPPPAPPEAGKAQIILIESGRGFAARYGMDGAWMGANDGDSYFAVTIAPGEHHLCLSFQIRGIGVGKLKEESVRMLTFTAEAGKVYYFEASTGAVGGSAGSSTSTYVHNTGAGATGGQFVHSHSGGSAGMPVFGFEQLDDDTGKYRIKAWKLATWKTNK
jgi:hypothetical protein